MFKRLSIFALTLVLTLGLLVVPALAGENGCTHECTVENGCAKIEWTCTKEEHTHTDECFIFQNGVAIAIRCPKTRTRTLMENATSPCTEIASTSMTRIAAMFAPEPEQPAASSGSNFLEPTYYADYEEDVVYLDPDAAEAADYAVTCRTLNVRKTPSTEYAPIAQIHRGDIVSVVDWEGDWAKIEWASAEGRLRLRFRRLHRKTLTPPIVGAPGPGHPGQAGSAPPQESGVRFFLYSCASARRARHSSRSPAGVRAAPSHSGRQSQALCVAQRGTQRASCARTSSARRRAARRALSLRAPARSSSARASASLSRASPARRRSMSQRACASP